MPGRSSIACLVVALAVATAGCGSEIGDGCNVPSDCSAELSDGKTCDTFQPGGYCTILGCDYNTCPGEAVCIRFFTGSFTNLICEPMTEDTGLPDATDDCSVDELCALDGHCVPRSAEIRYCMRSCTDHGDCRGEDYECRDLALMREHGGEPVLAPGQTLDLVDPPRFCAAAP